MLHIPLILEFEIFSYLNVIQFCINCLIIEEVGSMVYLRGNFLNLYNGYKNSNLIPNCYTKKKWAKAKLQFVN